MCDEHRDRDKKTAETHQHQEIEQIVVADQQSCRRGQLGITTTDEVPPEQQEHDDKNDDTGTYRLDCNIEIADYDQAQNPEYGN